MNRILVLIDNGHGSDTFGKRSPDGSLLEYAWTREIASMLEKRLVSMGIEAKRIVPESSDVSISQRVSRVNGYCRTRGAKNVLLVSIHNNAVGQGAWGSASGFSVFVSKNASAASKTCARIFTDEAISRGLIGNRSVPADKYWTWSWTTADIGILKSSNCPAVLTENLFMDSRKDVEYLLSDKGKEGIVDLHAQAIAKYIATL